MEMCMQIKLPYSTTGMMLHLEDDLDVEVLASSIESMPKSDKTEDGEPDRFSKALRAFQRKGEGCHHLFGSYQTGAEQAYYPVYVKRNQGR